MRRGRGWLMAAVLVVTGGLSIGSAPASVGPAGPSSASRPLYLDPAYAPAERAADLVARMTLAEKASQMISSQAAGIPRLGVRAYGWWNEAVHGLAREQTNDGANPPDLVNTTSYPVSLSLGSTWNPDLVYRVASEISDEAREVVRDNSLDLNFYSPTVNLARDPRWGRNDETYSEDPYLTAAIAVGYVNGMEGKTVDGRPLPDGGGFLKTSTTLKHYAANNSEFNRRTGSSDMDERTLREYYTAQFRAIIRRADPGSIMTAYNAVNGVPASANVHLLDRLGRQTYGFNGFYTSDCDSIFEIQDGHHWQPPGAGGPLDEVQRHAYANAAGVDLNCQLGYHDEFNFATSLPEAVDTKLATPAGTYSENDLDASLVRLFTTRIRLGEFDDPTTVPWVTRARARVPAGTWVNSDDNRAVTETPQRLQLARTAASESIVLLKNADTAGRPLLPLAVPRTGPYRVAVVGYAARPAEMFLGGYSSRQGSAGMAKQVNGFDGLRTAIRAVNPDATVDYMAGLISLDATQLDVSGLSNVGGYDVVVVYVGTDGTTAAEDTDRADLTLPGAQAELIRAVSSRNPHTVVYLETAGQVDVAGFEAGVPALLWSSYNGQRKGEALADVILGVVNPSGHLPFTWYRSADDLPPIGDYAIRPSATSRGRTYMYFTGPVQYPFGHGLSYTAFAYSAVEVDHRRVAADGSVVVRATVTNSGPMAGTDVVQVYAATPDAPATRQRPRQRLVAFRRVTLRPGQSQRLEFPVTVADLAFFDAASGRFGVDGGRYRFTVGGSSAHTDRRAGVSVTVTGALTERPAVVTAKPCASADEALGIGVRVIYPAGTTIQPRLTVAMSDETLYGYVAAGVGRPLPTGLTVSYHSSRPTVVAVGTGGEIRTVAPGVATVTATVTYQGAKATGQFVVKVR